MHANEYMAWAIKHEVDTMLQNEEIFDTPWTDTESVIKANNLEKVLDC